MFTGLVEEIGTVIKVVHHDKGMTLTVQCDKVLKEMNVGDSISVNGVCLTSTSIGDDFFNSDVMQETVVRTTVSSCQIGTKVNLERALLFGGRVGGHLVQGHVDGKGSLIKKTPVGDAVVLQFKVDSTLASGMIEKGSIAIDGVSLTLVNVEEDSFSVSLIPHTLTYTTLQNLQVGQDVNIECDMIGKYVVKWIVKGRDLHAFYS